LKSSESSQRSLGKDGHATLSALDKALRDALATLPHDDVVQHVAAVLADEMSERRDQHKAVPAVQREVRLNRLKVLLDELEAEYGKVPEAIREQTRRMWPNYEEGR
jgi:hypothetical protein